MNKWEADQARLREHLRGQARRFARIGERLEEARAQEGRIFVLGEASLEPISRVIASEFLRAWPVHPVSLLREELNDLEGLGGPSRVKLPKSVPEKVRQLAQAYRKGDIVLAFVHEGESSELRKALKIARKRGLQTLVIGGMGGRKHLRSLCDVFLTLPTRGIKTLCEASFICARLIARFARAEAIDRDGIDRDGEANGDSSEAAMQAWSQLRRVGEEASEEARRRVDESEVQARASSSRRRAAEASKSGSSDKIKSREKPRERPKELSRADAAKAEAPQERANKEKTGKHRRREPEEGSGARAREEGSGSRKRGSGRGQREGSGARSRSGRRRAASEELVRKPVSGEARRPKLRRSTHGLEDNLPIAEPLRTEESEGLVAPKWLEDNDSVQRPIGIGSSYKSSGIFGDIGLDSEELLPRYIRDALEPQANPPSEVAFRTDSGEGQRFVSNRFRVQECTLRFAFGAYPTEDDPAHPLDQLDTRQVAFLLRHEDEAAATLRNGDELWLRIDVPAFLEPILAQARIAGFESGEDDGDLLRALLDFTGLQGDHRRRIRLAAQSLAATRK